nr:hypothetical protein [uncultured Acetatifactor sp.]
MSEKGCFWHFIMPVHRPSGSGLSIFKISGLEEIKVKIKYEFADGTVSEVEVEESIGEVIIEDRRLEDNLSRKERYHCYSLDAAQFEGAEYASEETPETKMEREMDTERISQALDGLSEVQRRRILMLAEGKSVNEIARKEGVHHSVVSETISAARKKFKKFF